MQAVKLSTLDYKNDYVSKKNIHLAHWLSNRLQLYLVAGSIPAQNKYLYGLQIVVPGLGICACDYMFVNATHGHKIYSYIIGK